MVEHAAVSETPVVTRFAPSPTGYLHLGHAYAAWFAWRHACAAGGRFLLRLEDIDPERCRPEYAAAIEDDLRWLGLDWDGEVRVQSRHLAEYGRVLEQLAARHLAYPCFCSRADVLRELGRSAHAPHDPDGAPLYPGTCRNRPPEESRVRIAAGAPHAWRLNMARALDSAPPLHFMDAGRITRADPAPFGDVILGRRLVPASYHLCCVHDDALQDVTLVTRAEDLRASTHLHRLLQHLLSWPVPDYVFFPLLVGKDGMRLSKRDGAFSLREMRERGISANAILRRFQ